MKRLTGFVAMAVAFAAVAVGVEVLTSVPVTAQAPQPVQVTNTPLLVREVDPPSGRGYNFAGVAQFNPGDTQVVVSLGTLPKGAGLAVEFVSALASLPSGQRAHIRLFSNIQHFFAPAFVGTDATNDILVLSQPARYYVGGNLTATVTRFGGNHDSGTVQIGLSGHLIP